MRKITVSIFTFLFVFALFNAKSQENTQALPEPEKEDSLLRVIEKLQSDVSILSRIKISGYVQTQYQKADSAGIASVAGGNFASGVDQRFAVRRGRIKFAYVAPLSTYVLQFDASEGGFTLKDAYMKFTDPLVNAFSLTAGIFNRPFGYEIEYSSSSRECPERARVFQTLFPGERDLGACITFNPPKTSNYNFIKFDAGVFNGTGPNAKDFDNRKDIITRLTLNKSFFNENLKIGIGGSYHIGSMLNFTNTTTKNQYVYKMNDNVFKKDSSQFSKRQFTGLECQIAINSVIGLSQLRAEYLFGQQAGTSTSSSTPTAINTSDTYLRNFAGYYVVYSQNIAQLPFQTVVRYDVYDPNTKVSGAKDLTNGDIKYTTYGLGLIYRLDSNVKITAYYDIVENESTQLKGYWTDLKDNVFTLRFQYKF
jgi:phosphate-selective porin